MVMSTRILPHLCGILHLDEMLIQSVVVFCSLFHIHFHLFRLEDTLIDLFLSGYSNSEVIATNDSISPTPSTINHGNNFQSSSNGVFKLFS